MTGKTLDKVEIEGRTVQLFEDEDTGAITGYSFSQNKYYPDPLGLLPSDFKPTVSLSKTQEEIDAEIKETQSYPIRDLPLRNLEASTLTRFGVRTGLSEADGETVTTVHFPYTRNGGLVGYKNKLIDPKRFWGTGVTKGTDLFGWVQALASGSPKLFIVEGEMDVLATYQMLKHKSEGTKWSHLEPAVVSITTGAGGAKSQLISKQAEIYKNFKDVVLIFDMDEPGQDAARDVASVMDVHVASLPMKDANECLIKGRSGAFCNSILYQTAKPKNTRLIRGSSLSLKAKTPAKMGLTFPWKGLTDKTKGIRRGEIIIIGAGVAMG